LGITKTKLQTCLKAKPQTSKNPALCGFFFCLLPAAFALPGKKDNPTGICCNRPKTGPALVAAALLQGLTALPCDHHPLFIKVFLLFLRGQKKLTKKTAALTCAP